MGTHAELGPLLVKSPDQAFTLGSHPILGAPILNRVMILVIAVVSLWIAISLPKFLNVFLWTGLGGFTLGIRPSLILGALFRRATRAVILASMIGSIAVLSI